MEQRPPKLGTAVDGRGRAKGGGESKTEIVRRSGIRRRSILLGLAGVAGFVAYVAYGLLHRATVEVVTTPVVRADIEDIIAAAGKVQPRAYVDVGAQASGELRRILVKIGDVVSAGQPLAEIDPQILSAKVEADKAELARLQATLAEQLAIGEFAEAQLDRVSKLLVTSAASKATVDQSRRDVKMSAAKVGAIRAQIEQMQSTLKADEVALGYTKIFAPMAGTVISIDAREGQTLNATYSTPQILRIADLRTMTVWTQVSEADVPRLKVGMPVYFSTLGHHGQRWNATVRQILPAPVRLESSATTGQSSTPASTAPATNNVVLYIALFDVDNAAGELRPDMTARVSFVVASAKGVLTIPIAAIKEDTRGGDPSVEVATAGGGIETRRVRLGLRTRFTAQVIEGLREGELVATGERQRNAAASLVRFGL